MNPMVNLFMAILFIVVSMVGLAFFLTRTAGQQSGMARIILSDILNDIRNSIGAHVYSNWKGIGYIREKAALVSNPRSSRQGAVRMIVEKYSRRWFATLTDAQRALWEAFAAAQGSASKSDQTQGQHQIIPISRKVMSGMNSYIQTNALLISCAMAEVDDAPIGRDGSPQPYNLAVAYGAGPPEVLSLTWLEPAGMPANTAIRLWGMGVKYAHKQFITSVGLGILVLNIQNMRIARGIQNGIPTDFYRFQADAITSEGIKSAGSNIAEINKTA